MKDGWLEFVDVSSRPPDRHNRLLGPVSLADLYRFYGDAVKPSQENAWPELLSCPATARNQVARFARAAKSNDQLTNLRVIDIRRVVWELTIDETGDEYMLSREALGADETGAKDRGAVAIEVAISLGRYVL